MTTETDGTKPKRRKAGRPRSVTPETLTPEMLEFIDAKAEAQCKDKAIASALGWDHETFSSEYGKRMTMKRAQGEAKLLQRQFDKGMAGDTTMLIWLGKQHLDQSDHAQVDHGVTDPLAELIREINGTRILPKS